MLQQIKERLRHWFSTKEHDAALQQRLEDLRHKVPVPVFWLLGKTQTGKTSIVKYLTGADEAEIGHGFRPCTRTSRRYDFPSAESPLLCFIDTRGLDEPGYDPAEDIATFDAQAHVIVVTVKALDHAQENLLNTLKTIRQGRPQRPVLLALTCLHEGYPQQQHPQPYPFGTDLAAGDPARGVAAPPSDQESTVVPEDLRRSIEEQQRRFAGLVDKVVPIDLTRPEDGFHEVNYGGEQLKQALLAMLPGAYRQTLITLDETSNDLKDAYARAAAPRILSYSLMAAGAGAIPIPFLDLVVIPGIQTKMIHDLADMYGRPMDGKRFLELAASLGMGVLVQTAARQVVKLIPIVGPIAGSALAATSTYALGRSFCYYYSSVHKGHVPSAEDLKDFYRDQLRRAEEAWAALRNRTQG
jgi:uncharacterized protein (DUF697 family)